MTDAATLVRNYLSLLETCDPNPAAYAELLHPEVAQSACSEPLIRTVRGGARLTSQAFDLHHLHTCANDTVVVEAQWWGEVGPEPASSARSQHLTAHCCLVFEVHEGRIFRQRQYDC